ncbi:hypothetical protein BDY21DRAFT_197898 [Lineolata rhizophorae]|uniref:Uncharacterized protein n=1 Tax=Lineolata rhizophorae TaxID=578093 RepID=A0A6A6P4M4_9PEZI|nr:hypothetical protein BDY21DRAFT_197898 [Lineolata rhizophorae]
MCELEHMHWVCGHEGDRIIKYCHFARNDPKHYCGGVQVRKREMWHQYECPSCASWRAFYQQQAQQAGQQGQ